MSLYKVEAILDKDIDQSEVPSVYGRIWYKIKWLGYPQEQATWEPLSNLTSIRQLIDQFERNHRNKGFHSESKGAQKRNKGLNLQDSLNNAAKLAIKNQPNQASQSQEQVDKSSSKNRKQASKISKVPKISKLTAERIRLETNLNKTNKTKKMHLMQQKNHNSKWLNNPSVERQRKSIRKQHEIPKVQDVEVQSDQLKDQEFKIKELFVSNEGSMFYLVEENGNMRYVAKQQVLREHPYALIQFYQSRANFIPKTMSSPPILLKQPKK